MKLKVNKTTWSDIGIITGVILGVMFLVFAINGLYPFGNGLISRADMTQQTIPALTYYWDVLHFKASPFFTWKSGMGINISGAFNLGGFFSPLNIFLYFVTRNSIYKFANIFVAIKMACIGISMYAYLRKYKNTRSGQIIGSILYAFGGACLVHYQIMLIMEAAFFLPLMMIGLDRITSRKKPLFFVFILAYAFITDIYTTALSLVFIFLYYGAKYYTGRVDKKDRKKNTAILGISVITAIGLSAFVSLPAWIAISSSPRGARYSSILITYASILFQEFTPTDTCVILRLLVNISLPFAVIIFHFFYYKQTIKEQLIRYKADLILILMSIVAMSIPATEVFWCGGSRAFWPIRFIFTISFALISFAVNITNDYYQDSKNKKFGIYIPVSIIAAVVITFLIQKWYLSPSMAEFGEFADSIIGLLLEFILLLTYFLLFANKKKLVALTFVLTEITTLSMIAFYPNKELRDGWNPSVFYNSEIIAESIADMDTSEFHRVKNIDYTLISAHHPLLMDTEGVSNFWHVINTDTIRNNNYLGYEMSYSRELDNGGTVFSDALIHNHTYFGTAELPTKLFDKTSTVDVLGGVNIYNAKYPLPLVLSVNDLNISGADNYFEQQNLIYDKLITSDRQLLTDLSDNIIDCKTIIDIQGTQAIYFFGDNPTECKAEVSINGNPVLIPSYEFPNNYIYLPFTEGIPDNTHIIPNKMGNYSGIVCLGFFTDETITIEFSGDISSDQIHLASLNIDNYIDDVNAITSVSPVVNSITRGNTTLEMDISNINSRYIILPIAYQDGWNCEVNGKPSELKSFAGMGLIEVTGDSACINMSFVAPGTKIGIIISCIFAILVCFCMAITRKITILTTKLFKLISSFTDIVFIILFYSILILMFAIPILSSIIPGIPEFVYKLGKK
ncbi:MAG: YfhO family protein [Saccharofermentans sp.]|nr:YfhO family protein [Saccharofermentans sp.]